MNNLERWHANLRGELPGGLDELLADDAVFLSPIVFSPQEGKELTKMYLNAAGATFSGGGSALTAPSGNGDSNASSDFHYVKEVSEGNHSILEFECTVEGITINGVDIITWNDEGKISEFKVMIRPLKAINLMHAKMKAMLEQMG